MKTPKKMPPKHQRSSVSFDIKSLNQGNIPAEDHERAPGTQYEIDSAYIDIWPSIPGAVHELGRAYLTITVDSCTGRIVHAIVNFGTIPETPSTIPPSYYRPQLQAPAERALNRLLRPSTPN